MILLLLIFFAKIKQITNKRSVIYKSATQSSNGTAVLEPSPSFVVVAWGGGEKGEGMWNT